MHAPVNSLTPPHFSRQNEFLYWSRSEVSKGGRLLFCIRSPWWKVARPHPLCAQKDAPGTRVAPSKFIPIHFEDEREIWRTLRINSFPWACGMLWYKTATCYANRQELTFLYLGKQASWTEALLIYIRMNLHQGSTRHDTGSQRGLSTFD
jgi:hypothetical protein